MEQDERDKAMGVGCGGSPTPCAAAVPGAAQPGPGAAIYLPWLVPRAGGRAVTRQLLNEGRRMTPGGSGCGGGGQWQQSPAPNGFSWFSFPSASSPTPFPWQDPAEAASPGTGAL